MKTNHLIAGLVALLLPCIGYAAVDGPILTDCYHDCMADPDMGFMQDCLAIQRETGYCEPIIHSGPLDDGRHIADPRGEGWTQRWFDNVNRGDGTRPGIQPTRSTSPATRTREPRGSMNGVSVH